MLTEKRIEEIREWAEYGETKKPGRDEVGEILGLLDAAKAVADAAAEMVREQRNQFDLGRPTLACGRARDELDKALREYGTEAPCR